MDRGHGRDHMIVGYITTYAFSALLLITINVGSLNPTQARCT